MKKPAVSRMCVRGFRSIRECDLALGNLNVLIGSNGAGKSSFLQVFSLLQRMATGRLQVYVGQCGGPDALLWYGSRKTRQLAMDITFADGRIYSCTLEPTQDNRFLYTEESVQDSEENTVFRENGHFESRLAAHSERHESLQVFAAMRNWHPVHLNDAGAWQGSVRRSTTHTFCARTEAILPPYSTFSKALIPNTTTVLCAQYGLLCPSFGTSSCAPVRTTKVRASFSGRSMAATCP